MPLKIHKLINTENTVEQSSRDNSLNNDNNFVT
jgi:hypothetical protein